MPLWFLAFHFFDCVYKNLNLNKLLNKHLIMIINIDNKKRFLFIISYVSWKFIILENLFIIFLIPHFLLNIYNYWLKIKIINYNPKMYNQMTKFNLYFSSIFISSYLKNIIFILFIFIFYTLNYINKQLLSI